MLNRVLLLIIMKKKLITEGIIAAIIIAAGLVLWLILANDNSNMPVGNWVGNPKAFASNEKGNVNIFGKDTLCIEEDGTYYGKGIIEVNFIKASITDNSVHGRVLLMRKGKCRMKGATMYQNNSYTKAILLKKWNENGKPLTYTQDSLLTVFMSFFDKGMIEKEPKDGIKIEKKDNRSFVGIDQNSEETIYSKIDLNIERFKSIIDKAEKKDLASKK